MQPVLCFQMESTMLLLAQGEAGIDCCDPFVEALKKRTAVRKYGSHIIICDLLVVAVRDGNLCCLFLSVYFAAQFLMHLCPLSFSVLLFVERQECHPACKQCMVRCCHLCLSGTSCKWFVYGPADAAATPSSPASVKSRWFTFLVSAYPGYPEKGR